MGFAGLKGGCQILKWFFSPNFNITELQLNL
jgi:hypothetical protein